MHKLTITLLRIWLACTSLGAFLFGWVVFAHSAKPAPLAASSAAQPQVVELAPLPALAPLPPMGQAPAELQPLPGLPAMSGNFLSFPRLRTRGS